MAEFAIEVSYSQLAIFASSLDRPFNDWSQKHVDQGFSWRPGSACFRTLIESGRHVVEVEVADFVDPVHPEAVRVIEVPFEVPTDGAVDVASISDSVSLTLPPGAYLLRCELMPSLGQDDHRVKLSFSRKDEPHFAVVVADSELHIDRELLKTANPA